MALPLPMNSSKKNLSVDQWAETEFRGDDLDAGYVTWLRRRQNQITTKATQMINNYLKNN